MNADPKFRKWLNHKPRPAYMLCDDTRVDAPATDRGWAEVAESIEQLEPRTVKCMSGDGKLLRAKPFEWWFPREDEDVSAPVAQPVPAPTSPEQAMLQQFAVLLSNAHVSAAQTHGPIMQQTMAFTERLSARLTATEAMLDEARERIADLEAELAEAGAALAAAQNTDGGIGGLMVQGMQMRAAADAAKTNGAVVENGAKAS